MDKTKVYSATLLAFFIAWGLEWNSIRTGTTVIDIISTGYCQEPAVKPDLRRLRTLPGRVGEKRDAQVPDSLAVKPDNDKPTAQSFTDTRDGRTYTWVQIGDHVWMSDNLAYLPSVSPQTEGNDLNAAPLYYVYGYQGTDVNEAKALSNYTTYGVLYNRHAALNACPAGWHLPSEKEWEELELYLGMTSEDMRVGQKWRGTDVGTKIKAASGWAYDKNGSNESGFNALPAGIRHRSGNGQYIHVGMFCYFWTGTELPGGGPNVISTHAWMRGLNFNLSTVYYGVEGKSNGYCVRCVRD